MSILIEKEALATLLFGILSCQCPVTSETDQALFREFRAAPADKFLPLAPFMEIADRNPEKTPLHLFVDFCSYHQPDPDNFAITHDDAIRYFSSRFHFDRILASVNPLTVSHPPGHLVGHMLLPVRLEDGLDRVPARIGDHTVHVKNLFHPAEIRNGQGQWFGLHMGIVVTALSEEQALMARAHLGRIGELTELAARVDEIDYADYQTFGDHQAHVIDRYERNL